LAEIDSDASAIDGLTPIDWFLSIALSILMSVGAISWAFYPNT
jgi:hypothetical protein